MLKRLFDGIRIKNCIIIVLSGIFLAFGLYHVHSLSGVTEGGALGLNLLLEHWFDISPSITNLVTSVICYFIGWRVLGRHFIIYSAVAASSFSLSYRIIEQFPPLWEELYNMPLLASVIGAVFVGVGTGVAIRYGGAICSDDALAMTLSHLTKLGIEKIYLISDLLILTLSLTYIPLSRIAYSLFTVILSGQIIGLIQRIKRG